MGDLIRQENTVKIFGELDIDEGDLLDLFDTLDASGDGSLNVAEFVTGICKLRGPCRRGDVVHVAMVLRNFQYEFEHFRAEVMQSFSALGGQAVVQRVQRFQL